MSAKTFTAILFLSALAAAGQTPGRRPPRPSGAKPPAPSAPQTPWPLAALEVSGNKMYTQAAILAATGLKTGQTVTKEDFEKARDRLIATGAFETVGFEFAPTAGGKAYRGRFDVVEIQQVYPYRFEQLPGTDAELVAYLKQREPLFGTRIPGTNEVIARFARELNEYAAARNFGDTVVGRVVPGKSGELAILFRPATPPPVMAETHFSGSQVLAPAILNNAFGEVAVGVPYSEERVRELLDSAIRPLFEARGRLRVQFPTVSAKPAGAEVKGLNVSITVEDGPEFNFGKLSIVSPNIPAQELYKVAALKPETRADFSQVKAAQEALRKRYQKAGYMDATTTVDRHIDDKAKTVDLTLRIEPGPRYRMGKLEIRGLDVTSEPAIRQLWGMKTDAPYDSTYPAVFLDRIKEEGYLDNLRSTRFTHEVHPEARTVDVTLYFVGGSSDTPEHKDGRGERP